MGVNALEITSADGTKVMRFSAQNLKVENVRWSLASIDGQALPEGVSAQAIFTPAESPQPRDQKIQSMVTPVVIPSLGHII